MIRYAVVLGLMTVVGATAFKQPAWILHYTSGSFLMGGLFLLLAIGPWGQIILGNRKARVSFPKYLGLLALGQLALGIISVTAAIAFIEVGPKVTEGFFVLGEAQAVINQYYWHSWGFFPWGLFGLWALMIAYVHYVKGTYPLVGNAVPLFLKNQFEPIVKGALEHIVSTASLFCLSFSIGGAILLLSFFVEAQLKFPLHIKAPLITLMVLSCVCSLVFNILRTKLFLKWSQKISLDKIPFLMLVIMVPIFIFSAFLGGWCLEYLPHQMAKMHASCVYPIQTISIPTRVASLYWGWWLLWVPLAGSFIARVSQGRTVREVIIGVLSVPLLLYILRSAFVNIEIPFIPIYAWVCLILSIATLGIVSRMMKGMKNNLFLYAGFMPLPTHPKMSRMDLRWAPILNGSQKCFIMIVMSILSAFLIHTLGGWFLIALQFLALGTFVISMLYAVFIALGVNQIATYAWQHRLAHSRAVSGPQG